MKPTDEERREVARRLRDNADESRRWVVPWAVFNDADEHGDIEVHNRLAELIEPEPERTCVVEHRGGGVFYLSCGHDSTERVKPDYCPTCGARVVSE